MEIQTTKQLMRRYATTEGYVKKFNEQKWIAQEDLIKEIDDMIKSVELAGYDNPIDESYHNALLNVKDAITSDSRSSDEDSLNKGYEVNSIINNVMGDINER